MLTACPCDFCKDAKAEIKKTTSRSAKIFFIMNILHVYGPLFNKKPFFHTWYRRRAKGEEDAVKTGSTMCALAHAGKTATWIVLTNKVCCYCNQLVNHGAANWLQG
ncbi:MAG: hypothetical protein IIT57_07090 [Treponema sp.]|nr:hypothetical protein [Treponema sp.]